MNMTEAEKPPFFLAMCRCFGGYWYEIVRKLLCFNFKSLSLQKTLELFRVYLLSSFYMRQGSLGRGPCYFCYSVNFETKRSAMSFFFVT